MSKATSSIYRPTTLVLLGLGLILGLAGSSVGTASVAEAQTVGMERRQDRRMNRQDRREVRRDARQIRREGRRTAREVRRQ
jgi:uncharacterized membrane protein